MSMLSTLSLLWGPVGKVKVVPITAPDDDVLPLHSLDDTAGNRSLILAWTMRFNDVLDPTMLHEALSRLLAREGWRKLGGRLRMDVCSNPFTPFKSWKYRSTDTKHSEVKETPSSCATLLHTRTTSSWLLTRDPPHVHWKSPSRITAPEADTLRLPPTR
jgi:hypothetical protein